MRKAIKHVPSHLIYPAMQRYTQQWLRKLEQPNYTPPKDWLPITEAHPKDTRRPITFNYRDRQFPLPGIFMSKMSERGVEDYKAFIKDPDDLVFRCYPGIEKIVFRIMWPGYTRVADWARVIDVVNPPMTRVQLAYEISEQFCNFMDVAKDADPEDDTEDTVRVGRGIKFKDLVLVSLYNLCGNVWQAEVALNIPN